MCNISLIALDIGGTLLSDNNTISKSNIESIKFAKSKGIKVALVTAREYSSTKYISNQINCDYGVFSNGSHLVDIDSLQTLKCSFLKTKSVLDILEYCKKHNLYIHLNQEFSEVSDSMDYFNLKHHLLNEGYPADLKSNCHLIEDLYNYILNNKITKIVIASDEHLEIHIKNLNSILKKYNLFITEYNKDLYEDILDRTINYIEIGAEKDDKSVGLLRLSELLEIPKNEILVFGDGDNDLEMFQTFENSVCMNNGKQKIKKLAKYVTNKDNNNSGVAEGIYHFVGGRN